jgi:hypothetical protein
MVSQQVQDSVVEELRKDIIPDNNYIRRIIESKSDLKDHIDSVVTNYDQSVNIPAPTAEPNYWRRLVRKMPVSGPDMEETIKAGIDKVIPEKVRSKPGYRDMTDIFKRLGVKQIEYADDICMALI